MYSKIVSRLIKMQLTETEAGTRTRIWEGRLLDIFYVIKKHPQYMYIQKLLKKQDVNDKISHCRSKQTL
jgi:hypothetical protein